MQFVTQELACFNFLLSCLYIQSSLVGMRLLTNAWVRENARNLTRKTFVIRALKLSKASTVAVFDEICLKTVKKKFPHKKSVKFHQTILNKWVFVISNQQIIFNIMTNCNALSNEVQLFWKGHKSLKKSPTCFDATKYSCFVKPGGRFFQILWPSQSLNFWTKICNSGHLDHEVIH